MRRTRSQCIEDAPVTPWATAVTSQVPLARHVRELQHQTRVAAPETSPLFARRCKQVFFTGASAVLDVPQLYQEAPSRQVSARTSSWKLAAVRRPLAATAARSYATDALHSPPDPSDNFCLEALPNYIDEMYMQWKQDPKSVHVSWQVYFKNMESGDIAHLPGFSAATKPGS
ncbi:2-oxoglutarate dehydrogenase E1 component [Metarhizium acridum]|nr:2-oxoglutarate dehydrogenase E1 component [Metarhizium acridum]